jgi:hypothetical protein
MPATKLDSLIDAQWLEVAAFIVRFRQRRCDCDRLGAVCAPAAWAGAEKGGVHARDQHVVAQRQKVRHTVGRIADPGWQVDHFHPVPIQAHQDFRIEIHAFAERMTTCQRLHRCDRIDPEAAHRIANRKRERVNPNPDVGQVARVQAQLRHRLVVHRAAGDDRLRMLARQVDEARDIASIVLAVGVDLQQVGVAGLFCMRKAGHDGSTLALVDGVAYQHHAPGEGGGQTIEFARAAFGTAIVDQDARQAAGQHGVDHRTDGVFVVVHRNQDARLEHYADARAKRSSEWQ